MYYVSTCKCWYTHTLYPIHFKLFRTHSIFLIRNGISNLNTRVGAQDNIVGHQNKQPDPFVFRDITRQSYKRIPVPEANSV